MKNSTSKKQYNVLDLFCGAGGFSCGLRSVNGFNIAIGADFDKDAGLTFSANHPRAQVVVGDITSAETKNSILEKGKRMGINMVIGGPPCQGFSLKGKKMGLSDPRNFLYKEFHSIVKELEPEIFVMENVKQMISAAEGFFIKEIVKDFEDLGYECSVSVLDSSNFGVPQIRKRAFIVGSKLKDLKISNIMKSEFTSPKKITVREAISDLCYLNSGEKAKKEYLLQPQSDYQKLIRSKNLALHNHEATTHSKIACKKMSLIPENGNKTSLPSKYQTKQKFLSTWSRLNWEGLSPTIDTRFDTPSNGQNIHPILNRAITPREAARLQSFPDSFVFHGKKTKICKQIGNAVPPLLAAALGRYIVKETQELLFWEENSGVIWNADSLTVRIKSDKKIDAIITDPPYNISKVNNLNTLKKRKGVDFGEWDKEFNTTNWIKRYANLLKPGGCFIVFCSYLFMGEIIGELQKCGLQIKDLIKWRKSNPMPRNVERRYVQDTEFAVWAVKPGKWTFNKNPDKTYLRAEFASSVVAGSERTVHPTQKSLSVMKELIKIHTEPNDLIVDPFMGSGTTCLAAKETGRKYLGIELDPSYFAIAKDRLSKSGSHSNGIKLTINDYRNKKNIRKTV